MIKKQYYCDCCKKQVERESELTLIQISLGSLEGVTYKEVCHDCWKVYTNRIAEVARELFKND